MASIEFGEFFRMPVGPRGLEASEKSLALDGRRIRLTGYSNVNSAFDKSKGHRGATGIVNDYGFRDQPMLDEMTDKALPVLNTNNTSGFVLMIEGASIDRQARPMDSDRWILETLEFDRAVQKAKDFATANPVARTRGRSRRAACGGSATGSAPGRHGPCCAR